MFVPGIAADITIIIAVVVPCIIHGTTTAIMIDGVLQRFSWSLLYWSTATKWKQVQNASGISKRYRYRVSY